MRHRFTSTIGASIGLLFHLFAPDLHANTTAPTATPTPHDSTLRAFRARPDLDLLALMKAVDEGHEGVQERRLDLALAQATSLQSRLWDNPTVDVDISTIPIGGTNPPDLPAPLANVPAVGAGISYQVLIGKRGHRRARADALTAASSHLLDLARRHGALALARSLADVAIRRLRLVAFTSFQHELDESLELSRARLRTGFATPLEVERLEIEARRYEQQRQSTEAALSAALADCATLVSKPCLDFSSDDEPRRFIELWLGFSSELPTAIHTRADLRALEAEVRAADADLALAHAQRIPDPTARLGFTHDRFVAAGNQQNSIDISLSVPVPLFDHGQAAAATARARREHLQRSRVLRLQSATARVRDLRGALVTQLSRRTTLTQDTIPRARATVDSLSRAADAKLISQADVIQARRTLYDLMLDELASLSDSVDLVLLLLAELPADPSHPLEGTTP